MRQLRGGAAGKQSDYILELHLVRGGGGTFYQFNPGRREIVSAPIFELFSLYRNFFFFFV